MNFIQKAIATFRYQAANNAVYREFIAYLGTDVEAVNTLSGIPFLPIQFFKSHKIVSGSQPVEQVFTSSGTTGSVVSRHYVSDLALYEQSFLAGFEQFYGLPSNYCFLCLLPSYLEREGSSLVYMADRLIKESKHSQSGFYLDQFQALKEQIVLLEKNQQPTILLGVTYALLDLMDAHSFSLKHTFIMETGGMKGKRKELTKAALYKELKKGYGVEHIHSEYGMTELLSQAYGIDGIYRCSPSMKVLIRDVSDPLTHLPIGKTGAINIIDLANWNSCSFIATDDLGRLNEDGSFQIMGRMDNSDIRGCNLMVGGIK